MSVIDNWLESLHLGALNVLLLGLIILVIRGKLREHDRMYQWYIGKRAIEKKEEDTYNGTE